MSSRRFLPRRTLLRGATACGALVTIGLPVLDAMLSLTGRAQAADGDPPQRFVLWFWGNGTEPGAWAPAATGPSWTPTTLLGGLAGVADYVSIVSGTKLPTAGKNNPHVEGVVGILAGGNPVVDASYGGQSNDWDFMTTSGPTVDELAADLVGGNGLRSLVLSVTPLHEISGPGTAVRYTSHRGPYLFNPPADDPAAVFQSLFGGGIPSQGAEAGAEALARANVLDAVKEDLTSLKIKLGAQDRERLEHHLDGINDLQKAVRANDGGLVGESCMLPKAPLTAESYRERARQMSQLIAMAFACDLTRVVSMEFSSPASHAHYPDIFPERLVFNGEPTSFHEYEHQIGVDANVRTGLSYFMNVFGDFLTTLKNTHETDGNLLDHVMVLGTSEVSDGWKHGFDDYPLLVAGRANGLLKPGQHVRLSGEIANVVPYTCLKALGYAPASWGKDQYITSRVVSELLA